MEISVKEVRLTILKPQNNLLAFASCTINDCFFIGGIALYSSPTHPLGFRTVFPTRKLASGQQLPIAYPYTKNAEEAVTTAIVNKYLEVMNNFHSVDV